MANNYTTASFLMPVGTPDNAEKAMEIFDNFEGEEYGPGFECSIDDNDQTCLWIRSDEFIDVDSFANYAIEVGRALKLKGKFGFSWAETCSKLRLDEFGGGACIIDWGKGTRKFITTWGWLNDNMTAKETV